MYARTVVAWSRGVIWIQKEITPQSPKARGQKPKAKSQKPKAKNRSLGFARDFACGAPAPLTRKAAQLNKTFCLLFTQKACLFEMIIRTYLS
jgi:hypothetical protein